MQTTKLERCLVASALFLVLLAALPLCGCGGGGGEPVTCYEAIEHYYAQHCQLGTLSKEIAIYLCQDEKGSVHEDSPACDDEFQEWVECLYSVEGRGEECSKCNKVAEKQLTCS